MYKIGRWPVAERALPVLSSHTHRVISSSACRCRSTLKPDTSPLSEAEIKGLPVNSLDTDYLAEALELDRVSPLPEPVLTLSNMIKQTRA